MARAGPVFNHWVPLRSRSGTSYTYSRNPICYIAILGLLISCTPAARPGGSEVPPRLESPPPKPDFIDPDPPAVWLSPEESLQTMYLPQGYRLELVASEP